MLEKVNAGEDFADLIAQYNYDPGMRLADEKDAKSYIGYYFTKDYSYIKQFIDGTFALKENETSGLIETSYGYHILKRVPVDMDYVNANVDTMLESHNSVEFNKVFDEYLYSLKIEYNENYEKLKIDSIK